MVSSAVLMDVVLVLFNFYSYSKFVAFITGTFFGSVVFLYILSVFENSFSEYSSGKK